MYEITACLFLLYVDANDQVGREQLMMWERGKNCWSNIFESEKGIGSKILSLNRVLNVLYAKQQQKKPPKLELLLIITFRFFHLFRSKFIFNSFSEDEE